MAAIHRFPILAGLLVVLCTVSLRASAFAIFVVGAGCPYSTVQSALDAAAATPGADYVWIAKNLAYSGQQLYINDTDGVDIEGGFTDCNDFDIGPNDTTTLSGSGNFGGPVFTISGNSNVYLGNLVITGAEHTNGKGGGISFIGTGALALGNTTVSLNKAGFGAGIYIEQSGGDLSLTLLANTSIIFNTASSDGGGIELSGFKPGIGGGYAELYANEERTLIGFNKAGGMGGGLFLKWISHAFIGSPGYNGLGVIYDNQAADGGGIAVSSPTGFSSATGPVVSLYATNAAYPVRIQSNSASEFGGAVYLQAGPKNPNNNACLIAQDFRFDDNIAPDGSAIYAESNFGDAYVLLNDFIGVCESGSIHPVPTVRCAAGITCNSIDGNGALDAMGNRTSGTTVYFHADGQLLMDRVNLRNNVGGTAVHTVGSPISNEGLVEISNSLIAENSTHSDLFRFDGPDYRSGIYVSSSTITHNVIDSAYMSYSEARYALSSSIIDQPGVLTVFYAGPNSGFSGGGNIANDTSTLGNGSVPGAPTFVNAAGGDYHLQPWSLGVDFTSGTNSSDLDGNARVKDLASVANAYSGSFQDAGAFEIQYVCAADEILCSGFEY